MKRYLKELKPTEFEDIIAMVSLYRPGPMEFIPDYIDGKHGRRKVSSALITRWEADRDSGVLAELEAELEAEAAEVTPEPEAVEAVA